MRIPTRIMIIWRRRYVTSSKWIACCHQIIMLHWFENVRDFLSLEAVLVGVVSLLWCLYNNVASSSLQAIYTCMCIITIIWIIYYQFCSFPLENPYFRFTEGEMVTGRLYDEISLTVLFAIQPPINFQQAEIRLVNFATSSAPTVEPTITKINDFRATVVFNRILFSLNGLYDVQLRHDSQVVAQTSLNIVVNCKSICSCNNIINMLRTSLMKHFLNWRIP